MNDAHHRTDLDTRLDHAIEAATADLLRHQHNDERAVDDLVVGRRLLEMAVDLLSQAPDLELTELDGAFKGRCRCHPGSACRTAAYACFASAP
ncbi:hypothetical protein SAMN05421835_1407 [Amycolatopsis sacchari]|uniref:Uncharacterized protein n=1 Tax=Amycolatopsis sacchari TaxID=115433 RepID=A0A1I4D3E7_9PSEU|nr:hypothetical protein [Amycolatopsis sacchari]SFK87330.1 hypothetical protein SAMN05421835_1407 [Amycolatopsis sacchari]